MSAAEIIKSSETRYKKIPFLWGIFKHIINLFTSLCFQRSPEKGHDLDFTRCHAGNIDMFHHNDSVQDITGNQMEMTKNYQNWEQSYMVPLKKSDDIRNEVCERSLPILKLKPLS